MILMLAPGPNIFFGVLPSSLSYQSDDYSLVKILNNSSADQAALAALGCKTLSPFGDWGNRGFYLLTDLYAYDTATPLPQYTIATVFNDGVNNGTWAKTSSGSGAGNWTQVSLLTLESVLAQSEAEAVALVAAEAVARTNADVVLQNQIDLLQGIIHFAANGSVTCATSANIVLSGEQTIHGFTTNNSRVLVLAQTDTTENGVWVSSSGAWSRASDANTSSKLAGIVAAVASTDAVLGGDSYLLPLNSSEIIVGVTELNFIPYNDISLFVGITRGGTSGVSNWANAQIAVLSATTTAPPVSPAINDLYIVPAGATGAWTGWDGALAIYAEDLSWHEVLPKRGQTVFSAGDNVAYFYTGVKWRKKLGKIVLTSTFDTISQAVAFANVATDYVLVPDVDDTLDANVALTGCFKGRQGGGIISLGNFNFVASAAKSFVLAATASCFLYTGSGVLTPPLGAALSPQNFGAAANFNGTVAASGTNATPQIQQAFDATNRAGGGIVDTGNLSASFRMDSQVTYYSNTIWNTGKRTAYFTNWSYAGSADWNLATFRNASCLPQLTSVTACLFTGDISDGAGGSGTILNVTAVTSGALRVGSPICANGGSALTAGTIITALGTGTGGVGTYTVNNAQHAVSAAMADYGPYLFGATDSDILITGRGRHAITADVRAAAVSGGLKCGPFITAISVDKFTVNVENLVLDKSCNAIAFHCYGSNINIRGLRVQSDKTQLFTDALHCWGGHDINVWDCFLQSGDDTLAFGGNYGFDLYNVRAWGISVDGNNYAIKLVNNRFGVTVSLLSPTGIVRKVDIWGVGGIASGGLAVDTSAASYDSVRDVHVSHRTACNGGRNLQANIMTGGHRVNFNSYSSDLFAYALRADANFVGTINATIVMKDAPTSSGKPAILVSGSGTLNLRDTDITCIDRYGIDATGTVSLLSALLLGGSAGYTVGDVLTAAGGTFTTAAQITVDTVDGTGKILTWHISQAGVYQAKSTTLTWSGGTGTGGTFISPAWEGFTLNMDTVVIRGVPTNFNGVRLSGAGVVNSNKASAIRASGATITTLWNFNTSSTFSLFESQSDTAQVDAKYKLTAAPYQLVSNGGNGDIVSGQVNSSSGYNWVGGLLMYMRSRTPGVAETNFATCAGPPEGTRRTWYNGAPVPGTETIKFIHGTGANAFDFTNFGGASVTLATATAFIVTERHGGREIVQQFSTV